MATNCAKPSTNILDGQDGEDYVRCEQGYVPQQSATPTPVIIDNAALSWSTGGCSLDPGSGIDTGLTGECVKDICKNTNITDSNFEYDPLISDGCESESYSSFL